MIGNYHLHRYLARLKSYVRNRARPEGSIAEAYIANECIFFCSRYLQASTNDTENDPEVEKGSCLFPIEGQSYGSVETFMMDNKTWTQAHRYVLFNCESETIAHLKRLVQYIY